MQTHKVKQQRGKNQAAGLRFWLRPGLVPPPPGRKQTNNKLQTLRTKEDRTRGQMSGDGRMRMRKRKRMKMCVFTLRTVIFTIVQF